MTKTRMQNANLTLDTHGCFLIANRLKDRYSTPSPEIPTVEAETKMFSNFIGWRFESDPN